MHALRRAVADCARRLAPRSEYGASRSYMKRVRQRHAFASPYSALSLLIAGITHCLVVALRLARSNNTHYIASWRPTNYLVLRILSQAQLTAAETFSPITAGDTI